MARCQIFPFCSSKRAVVNVKNHRYRGFIDMNSRQRLRVFNGRNRVADSYIFHAGNGHNITSFYGLYLFPPQAFKCVKGRKFNIRYLIVFTAQQIILVHFKRTVGKPPNRHLSDVRVVIQVRDQQLRLFGVIGFGTGDFTDNCVKQNPQVFVIIT